MTSFYYYDQNPSGFCFLVQIRAFVIQTSLGLQNLNMKGKTNRILVVVVKWRHHAGLLLNTLYLSGSSSASSSLSLVSDSVHTTSSSSSCWLTSNWLRARKSCIIRSTKNYKSNRLTFIVLLFLSLQTVHECDLSTGSCRKTQNYSPHNSAENCKGGSTKNRNETSYVIQLTTGGLLCTSRLFSGPDPGTNGAVWIRVPRGLGRTAVPSGGKIYNMRRYVINGDSSSSVFCFFFDFFFFMKCSCHKHVATTFKFAECEAPWHDHP